jgi:hypothetical protein
VFGFQEEERVKRRIKIREKVDGARFSRFAGVLRDMHMFGICVSTVSTVKRGQKRPFGFFFERLSL